MGKEEEEGGGFRDQGVEMGFVFFEVEVVDCYVCALAEEFESYGAAYACGAAGYNGGFAGEEVFWRGHYDVCDLLGALVDL